MANVIGSGFAEFDRLAALFRRTRSLLDAVLIDGELPEGATELLSAEALPHIDDVQAGFRAWLRATEGELDELRRLVVQGGLGLPEPSGAAESRAALIEAMQARSGAGGSRHLDAAAGRPLAALDHARLVFAILPRTAPDDVHYPSGRRTYADIDSPRSPADLAGRIEELERSLWRVATGRRPEATDPSYRRTYGFFDAAERLSDAAFHAPSW